MRLGRSLYVLILVLALAWLAAALESGRVGKAEAAGEIAILAAIEGPIGPAALRHVEQVIAAARERDAEVLILRLDTPGGLASSMREIISEILGAPMPVVGYVAPPGAHAASAGTYILYATHVAAMAPGTNLGAATPVQIGGLPGLPKPKEGEEEGEKTPGDEDADRPAKEEEAPRGSPADPMTAKAVNDAVAFIRSLAELHGRNAEWAEKAVREAASLSAQQALELKVIDLVAEDVEALLAAIDGRTVTAGSAEHTLATKGLTVELIEPGFITRALGILANPNVAFILMMIGIYGLIFEFSNPGSIGPGVAGVICLVLGLYALNQLPLDYAGLALVVLGILLMVAEAFTPTFGVLGLGGLVAFVIGAAMLVDTDVPAYRLSWWVIGGVAVVSGAFFALLLGYVWRAHRRPVASGTVRLLGAEGEVLDWSDGEGHVWAEGERWHARGGADIAAGETVRVQAMEGLTLVVTPASGEAPPADRTREEKGA